MMTDRGSEVCNFKVQVLDSLEDGVALIKMGNMEDLLGARHISNFEYT